MKDPLDASFDKVIFSMWKMSMPYFVSVLSGQSIGMNVYLYGCIVLKWKKNVKIQKTRVKNHKRGTIINHVPFVVTVPTKTDAASIYTLLGTIELIYEPLINVNVMPCPSARTKYFLSQTKYFLSRTKHFLSGAKILS